MEKTSQASVERSTVGYTTRKTRETTVILIKPSRKIWKFNPKYHPRRIFKDGGDEKGGLTKIGGASPLNFLKIF